MTNLNKYTGTKSNISLTYFIATRACRNSVFLSASPVFISENTANVQYHRILTEDNQFVDGKLSEAGWHVFTQYLML